MTTSEALSQVQSQGRWPWRDDCGGKLAAEFAAILRDTLAASVELTVHIVSIEVVG